MGLAYLFCLFTADDVLQERTEGCVAHEGLFGEMIILQVDTQADVSIDASNILNISALFWAKTY